MKTRAQTLGCQLSMTYDNLTHRNKTQKQTQMLCLNMMNKIALKCIKWLNRNFGMCIQIQTYQKLK